MMAVAELASAAPVARRRGSPRLILDWLYEKSFASQGEGAELFRLSKVAGQRCAGLQ